MDAALITAEGKAEAYLEQVWGEVRTSWRHEVATGKASCEGCGREVVCHVKVDGEPVSRVLPVYKEGGIEGPVTLYQGDFQPTTFEIPQDCLRCKRNERE